MLCYNLHVDFKSKKIILLRDKYNKFVQEYDCTLRLTKLVASVFWVLCLPFIPASCLYISYTESDGQYRRLTMSK